MTITSRKRNVVASGMAGAIALLCASAVQAEGISRGAIIATTCYTCHGTYGVSPGSIPSINDISADRMVTILQGFRSGQRASTVMGRHASGYTDDEIKEAAAYLSNIQKRGK